MFCLLMKVALEYTLIQEEYVCGESLV
ncbi:hypothetical protein BDFB_010783 [Asbolus verrucosus]|uniref:Uncharacterized protein n=1 Tax=Asbolus verrucosus TaxID=1661398 RepID=A0A482VWT4_ASBVE|nr:hypothetical protein BDFB_010783 [Asbolus verrucosus]